MGIPKQLTSVHSVSTGPAAAPEATSGLSGHEYAR